MSIYDDMQSAASEILKEFNQSGVSYIHLTPAVGGKRYDPGTPTETEYKIVGGVARGVEYKYVDGTQIVASDGQVTCAISALPVRPGMPGFMIVGGQKYKIKKVTTVPPTGTPVVYLIFYER